MKSLKGVKGVVSSSDIAGTYNPDAFQYDEVTGAVFNDEGMQNPFMYVPASGYHIPDVLRHDEFPQYKPELVIPSELMAWHDRLLKREWGDIHPTDADQARMLRVLEVTKVAKALDTHWSGLEATDQTILTESWLKEILKLAVRNLLPGDIE